jgi:hypothetical protein
MTAQPGSRDRLVERLADLEQTVKVATDALAALGQLSIDIRAWIADGKPMFDAYEALDILTIRDNVFDAETELKRTLTAVRAESFRIMVEGEGQSLSAVARVTDRSRQFVTRLYEAAVEGALDGDESTG